MFYARYGGEYRQMILCNGHVQSWYVSKSTGYLPVDLGYQINFCDLNTKNHIPWGVTINVGRWLGIGGCVGEV